MDHPNKRAKTTATNMTSTNPPFQIENLIVINEARKANVPINTGVGYLDHMIDQLNSHAQVGVGMQILCADNNNFDDKNRLALKTNQMDLCSFVGSKLGEAIKTVIDETKNNSSKQQHENKVSRFCCPLDEALVECIIFESGDGQEGQLNGYTLPPYGIYPKGKGRSKIGQLETSAIEDFWTGLAKASGLNLQFQKIRGDNGHHIVESSFKAFSRALRNYLDNIQYSKGLFDCIESPNLKASIELRREGIIERSTKETSIKVELLLDGGTNGAVNGSTVDTGIPVLDEFFVNLAEEAEMTLNIKCQGDLWVDDHHTAEDVSIAVGQCLTQALGTKAGLNRMWLASASTTSSSSTKTTQKVEVTMDLSNRPCLRHNLHEYLEKQEYVDGDEENGNSASKLSCEMFDHVLDSLVTNSRMTVHIVVDDDDNKDGASSAGSLKDIVMCTGKAFGKALFACSMVDQRRAGQTASSKGTLSA